MAPDVDVYLCLFACLQMKTIFLLILFPLLCICAFLNEVRAQYWQQEIRYEMEVFFNDADHSYSGKQRIIYRNNSSDTLKHLYFHLFPNAFQPGSMMDVRSRTIEDPDPRVADRISKLRPEEQGFLHVSAIRAGRKGDLAFEEHETILRVALDKPLRPGKRLRLELDFEGQVPLQIRRSGRDSQEGVAYSMAQWYPKLCEYDRMGWHPYPYIGREFHGVWGDFDVVIHMDSAYTIASTGVLRNAAKVGKGYLPEGSRLRKREIDEAGRQRWHFRARRVHDFAWAADKDYLHKSIKTERGLQLRFFYKNSPDLIRNWEELPEYTERVFNYAADILGEYPYEEYNVVQGGDGGMEYPMLTLITGRRSVGSLVGVTVHEAVHSWYQLLLGSNEALYPWMDEGFTTYAGERIMNHIFQREGDSRRGRYYNGYLSLAMSGKEEPMSKHADHYNTNYAYGAASYNKGAVFVAQLGYIIGEELLQKGLKRYYEEWRFKHPDPFDFILVMEKVSGMELGWYLNYMMNTTEVIDYGIRTVESEGSGTRIGLQRIANMPMPIDLDIRLKGGEQMRVHIPVDMMLKAKEPEEGTVQVTADFWKWTHPSYDLLLDVPLSDIEHIEIDASLRLADVNRNNNRWIPDEPGDQNRQEE